MGGAIDYSTDGLIQAYLQTNASVFHLMGGAPALYLRRWPEVLEALAVCGRQRWIFHSNLLLNEGRYSEDHLKAINHSRAIYAVDVKGITPDEYLTNTRKKLNTSLFWGNIHVLEEAKPCYYFTFTNVKPDNQAVFWNKFSAYFGLDRTQSLQALSFAIDLVEYDALPFVDLVPWGPSGTHKTISGEISQ